MGEITVHASATIARPAAEVLAVLHDIAGQSSWWPGQYLSEPLEVDDEGLVLRARIGNDIKVAKEEFEVVYDHGGGGEGYSWQLASPTLSQRSQRGRWSVTPADAGCEVGIDFALEPLLPLPAFLLRKAVTDTIKGALAALKRRCEEA